jgi:hypothetical protein
MERPDQKGPKDNLQIAADKPNDLDSGRLQGCLQGGRNRSADQGLSPQAGYLFSPVEGIMMVQGYSLPFDLPPSRALDQIDVIRNIKHRSYPSLPVSHCDFHMLLQLQSGGQDQAIETLIKTG